MDDAILITQLNDYVFCPASIYFHNLYGSMDKMTFQESAQINGTNAHETVDSQQYSTSSSIMMGTDVYCEQFRLIGKIDTYDKDRKLLRERKKRIKVVYDGYVFQLYGQCLALREMGYTVEKLELYSMEDNKVHKVALPEEDETMYERFASTVEAIRSLSMTEFRQTNVEKCKRCVYEPFCDRSLED